MKAQMKLYNDPQHRFILQSMSKVDYFDYLSEDDKNFLVFNFEQQNLNEGSLM